ncbi:hypothetical protein [Bordetella genomosp. 11]|uniref:Uncharacterized protein n=1 Tax=Bordetella genomosp. 11 TaxID=1416808 RepID=A0A261UXI3_9BORD|nr:hypothetical protein [Bordetella genomosp. 11]OZI66277.1 hypothetical protein CAL28_00565 [Bordetella genomosp. 11]
MWLTYGLPIITPMAANRTFLAITTGRFGAPMGGLRSAQGGHAGVSTVADAGQAIAAAGSLALSLQLPIGCRA